MVRETVGDPAHTTTGLEHSQPLANEASIGFLILSQEGLRKMDCGLPRL